MHNSCFEVTPKQWMAIPGAENSSLFAIIDKPSIRTSNVYLIHTPSCFLVIDSGSDADHLALARQAASQLAGDSRLPVVVLLTHCHYDHCGHLTDDNRDLLEQGPQATAIHWQGAEHLALADAKATIAEIGEVEIKPYYADVHLFSPKARDQSFTLGDGEFSLRQKNWAIPGAEPGLLQVLTLPHGQEVMIYSTPGHSPDSCCVQVGDLLFIGDIPVATAPFTAGIHGWQAERFTHSLIGLTALLNSGQVSHCLPGHGGAMDSDKTLMIFGKLAKQCRILGSLELCDSGRIGYFSDYGGALLEQINEKFDMVAVRLERLSQKLNELEESGAAKKCRQMLDQASARKFLEQYELMRVAYRSGRHSKAEMSMSAFRTVTSLGRLVDFERMAQVVNPFILGRLKLLLTDFSRAAQGLRFTEAAQTADLNAEALRVIRLSLDPFGAQPANPEDIPHGEEEFRDYLIKRIAQVPVFVNTEVVCDIDDSIRIAAPLILPRFDHCLDMLLVRLAQSEARRISLSTSGGQEPRLNLDAEFEQPPTTPQLMALVAARRWLPTAAIDSTLHVDGTCLSMSLSFNEESALPY